MIKINLSARLAFNCVAVLFIALFCWAEVHDFLVRWPLAARRQELWELLRPQRLKNCEMERFGNPHDGGYVMCANMLSGVQIGYSYGIEGRDEWGCAISQRTGVSIHQYDCFDLREPTCEGASFIFHGECIGDKYELDEDGRVFDSLTSQMNKNGDSGKLVVMKMDVEGAEWRSLLTTSDEVLDRISQISMEMHGVHNAISADVLQKLKKTFYIADIHFNNNRCSPEFDPFPSDTYEVLWVNKKLGVLDTQNPAPDFPNPLHAQNTDKYPDCQKAWN